MGIPAIKTYNMPNIMKADYRILRSSDAEKSIQINMEFKENARAMSNDLERGYEAWDAYFAVNGMQWTAKKRKTLKEEDRHPWQFDILSPKIDTLAGSLVAEMPDIDWIPVEGERTTGTEAIKESYYSDKELFNYDNVILEAVRGGCVHNAWVQLTESNKYNPAGNIAITNCRPGFFIPSCYWKTEDDRDLKEGYKIAYMTADGMAFKYKTKSEAIKRAVEDRKKNGKKGFPTDGDEEQKRYESWVGDEYRVIEYHYLEEVRTKRLMGVKNNTNVWVPFPVTKDRQVLEEFAAINDIDWESVEEVPYDDIIHNVTTVTELDPNLILEDGKSRIQVKCLPFYHYTTSRYNGQDKGVAESLLDVQRLINEENSYMHEMIAKASGGSDIINEDIFKNNIQKQEFIKNKNKPGRSFFADLDNVRKVKEDINPQPLNPAVVTQLNILYNQMLPLVSRVSEAMSAQSSSEDSGILIERKYQLNRIANIMFEKQLKQFINNIGEGYYYQWQITYGDIEREITSRTGKNKIYLNRKDVIDGQPVVINSVPSLPRCRVVITENTHSATYQMRSRIQLTELAKIIPPDDYLRRNSLVSKYFSTLDFPDKEKAKLEMINELEDMKAQIQFIAEISGLTSQMKQGQLATLQAQNMIDQLSSNMNMAPQQDITTQEQQIQMPSMAKGNNNVAGKQMNTLMQNKDVMEQASANQQLVEPDFNKLEKMNASTI